MLCFHGGSCHCVGLVAGYVRNVGCFLILALPSGMVNVVSAGVAIQEVEVYCPCVGMWLPYRTTLSATVLVPLVVSAAPCSSAWFHCVAAGFLLVIRKDPGCKDPFL